jgi:hypothetical protein
MTQNAEQELACTAKRGMRKFVDGLDAAKTAVVHNGDIV